MKNLEMNRIISWGLVIMGVGAVAGWIFISVKTGTSSGTEVPISIISGLTGVLTGKNMVDSKYQKGQTFRSPNYENLTEEQKSQVNELIKSFSNSEN
jgi:hypothetical protein